MHTFINNYINITPYNRGWYWSSPYGLSPPLPLGSHSTPCCCKCYSCKLLSVLTILYISYTIPYTVPLHIILIKLCNVCKSLEIHNLGSLACICSAGRCPSCSWYWPVPSFWPCMHLDRCLVNESGEAGTLLHMANATWFIFNQQQERSVLFASAPV